MLGALQNYETEGLGDCTVLESGRITRCLTRTANSRKVSGGPTVPIRPMPASVLRREVTM